MKNYLFRLQWIESVHIYEKFVTWKTITTPAPAQNVPNRNDYSISWKYSFTCMLYLQATSNQGQFGLLSHSFPSTTCHCLYNIIINGSLFEELLFQKSRNCNIITWWRQNPCIYFICMWFLLCVRACASMCSICCSSFLVILWNGQVPFEGDTDEGYEHFPYSHRNRHTRSSVVPVCLPVDENPKTIRMCRNTQSVICYFLFLGKP